MKKETYTIVITTVTKKSQFANTVLTTTDAQTVLDAFDNAMDFYMKKPVLRYIELYVNGALYKQDINR